MKERLRLSQCMIVKNEEDNIRRALSWGKGLLWEQIVVDTGSTDRTAEIAREMGAKVFHFPWENDFSSAKNFALEQAKGNWIAFLDADEYFREEDVPKLKKFLTDVAERPENRHISLIRCTMVHLDDHGKPFSSMEHDRIFRNLPDLRYKNKVHETLSYIEGKKLAWKALGTDIPIIHTGYANKTLREKNKSQRNIAILREELEMHPDNYNIWSYLGDSLLAATNWEEAKKAYRKAISGPPDSIFPELAMNSITNLLRVSLEDHSLTFEEWNGIYRQYQNIEGENPDVEYWSGVYLYQCKQWHEATEHIEKAFSILTRVPSGLVVYMTGLLDQAYGFLADSYLKQGMKPAAVKNFALSLKVNPYQPQILFELLKLFQNAGEKPAEVVKFLGQLYDLSELKDKLYVIREAKKLLYLELSELLKTYLTEEEQQWLNSKGKTAKSGTASKTAENSLKRKYPQIHCRNQTDAQFLQLVNRLEKLDPEDILKNLKQTLRSWKIQNPELIAKLEQFYHDNPFWGGFKMDESVYTAFGNRISFWKEQQDDFMWLYESLGDYRSKRVLLAILENWLFLSTECLVQVKEKGFFFYDPDILTLDKAIDILDLMAGKGDYLKLLTEQLGEQHGIIFCCEQRPSLLPSLRKQTQNQPQIQVHETLKLDIAKLASVGLVRINAEASTWRMLKEYQALIQRNTPQIAITPYFSYEDLIRIPKWLNGICPDYRFYLRYFGEDLIPTDYILYAKKQ